MPSTVRVIKRTAYRLWNEYLEKSITHGLRMIKRTEGDSNGRYIWLALMTYILFLTHMDVYRLLIQFMQSPTETRLSPKVVHVRNMLFPAIGICSNNQISKTRLTRYANNLFKYQQLLHPNLVANTSTELAERILPLAGFLSLAFDSGPTIDQNLQNLHQLLVEYYGNETYPMKTVLRNLLPRCEDILKRCVLQTRSLNCTDIFSWRSSTIGGCCMFNYRRITENDRSDRELYGIGIRNGTIQFKTPGKLSSLQVVLQDNPDDFAFNTFPVDGFTVLVHYTDDYPDVDSGSVIKRMVSFDQEYDISLQPELLEGSSRMKQFSPKTRHCYFPDEGNELIKQDYYSFSECILECRFRSLLNHCGCSMPIFPAFIHNVTNCVLLDLPCIELWKAIWWQWNSFDYVAKNEDSVAMLDECKHCLPNCNVMTYRSFENSRPLIYPENSSVFKSEILRGLSAKKPTAFVKFFYKSAFSQVKTHDISGDWIFLLGRYGGICSLMYGFSFMGIIEILYFLTGKWFMQWWKTFWECYDNWRNEKKESQNQHELYWDELKPKYGRAWNKV